MTQIFLIRHAEAEGNLYRRVQGQVDTFLTPAGRRQLPFLTARFASVPLAAAYASDLRRAWETALAAVGERNLPVTRDARLREMNFGAWEDVPWGELSRREPEENQRLLNDPAAWAAPGSESFTALQDRMHAALEDIARRHPGESVAVASHGMAIRGALARIRGVASRDIAEVSMAGNTGVTLLTFREGRFTVEYENDLSHLPPEERPGRAGSGCNLWYAPYDLHTGKERFLNCYRDAWRTAHGGSLRGFDPEGCWRAALLRAADSPRALTAAWLEEDFAGVLALDERRGAARGLGWIAFLYVAPELRRRRCGIQLVGAAVSRFRALGRGALRLTVAPGNPARGFYEYAGFLPVDTEPGAVEPLIVMEKRL